MPRSNSRFFALCLIVLAVCSLSAAAQSNMPWIRNQWRNGNYAEVIGPLQDFLSTLSDSDKNFEADYMMATSLSSLPQYHEQGCSYFLAMIGLYEQNYNGVVDGRSVSLQAAMNTNCPPPPRQPGVQTVFELRIPRRGQILKDIGKPQSAQKPGRRPDGPEPRALEEFNGIYEMVHDGWRGTLELKGGGGRYIDAEKRTYRVLVEAKDYHIVFYVIGLGGENADGRGGQKFDGYLMTQTRDDIAGLTWWNNQPFGFYAIRRKR
jgi:hypothetical protein